METISLTMYFQVNVKNEGDYWAATIAPLGLAVFGDTKTAAINRVEPAIDFMMQSMLKHGGIKRICDYLDKQGIKYSFNSNTQAQLIQPIEKEVTVSLNAA